MTGIVMSAPRFRDMIRELRERGEGRRESGAFLLARNAGPQLHGREIVSDVLYYDDLDAASLTGGITMHASGLSRLNQHCREQGLVVVADVHTHPGPHVQQSRIDASNPMVSLPGHLAFIVPNYAAGHVAVRDLGGHRLRAGGWDDAYRKDVDAFLRIRPALLLFFVRLFGRKAESE